MDYLFICLPHEIHICDGGLQLFLLLPARLFDAVVLVAQLLHLVLDLGQLVCQRFRSLRQFFGLQLLVILQLCVFVVGGR